MAKYVVEIRRVEYFSASVVVEAKNQNEAIDKVQEKWDKDYQLYDEVTECQDDSSTKFIRRGLATEHDVKNFTNIR